MSLMPWISWRAAATPQAMALEPEDAAAISWRALENRARRLAGGLAGRGLAPGDVVAVLMGNVTDFVALLHAADLAGLTILPLNTRLGARELAFALDDTRARLLVHGGGAWTQLARAAAAETGDIAVTGADSLAAAPLTPRASDAPLAVVYTSGTSGRPKGVVLSREQFQWSAVASAAHLGAPPDERWLACLPLFHVGGLAILVRAVIFGASVVLQRRFDVERVSRALDAKRISIASLVPTMLRRLIAARAGREPPATLRCLLSGGATTPPALLEAAWADGLPAAPTYGLTEACSQVATLPPAGIGRSPDAGLRPLLGTRLSIRDDAGQALGPGETGEIWVRSPSVTRGYWRRPGATALALRDGWLRTGDAGRLDEDGALQVLDRRGDLIVSGGENVSPAEVEAVLQSHALVAEAAVAGEPDPDLGRRVAAWVVPANASRAPDPEELERHCRKHLAGYKIPRRFHLAAKLPRTASGKLRRAELTRL
jgi:O-succinylbenzoic acid--CoA ligase